MLTGGRDTRVVLRRTSDLEATLAAEPALPKASPLNPMGGQLEASPSDSWDDWDNFHASPENAEGEAGARSRTREASTSGGDGGQRSSASSLAGGRLLYSAQSL